MSKTEEQPDMCKTCKQYFDCASGVCRCETLIICCDNVIKFCPIHVSSNKDPTYILFFKDGKRKEYQLSHITKF